MRLNFINAQDFSTSIKCAIHKTGKLGFNSAAITKLGLSTDKGVRLATNSEDTSDDNLYMMVGDFEEGWFKLVKAGDYYYLNTKALFDDLGINYREKRIIYDITNFDYDGKNMYKLNKREVKQKESE